MALGPTQPPVQWVPCPIPGDKEAWHGVACPPASSAEIKDRVQYSYWSTLQMNVHGLLWVQNYLLFEVPKF